MLFTFICEWACVVIVVVMKHMMLVFLLSPSVFSLPGGIHAQQLHYIHSLTTSLGCIQYPAFLFNTLGCHVGLIVCSHMLYA